MTAKRHVRVDVESKGLDHSKRHSQLQKDGTIKASTEKVEVVESKLTVEEQRSSVVDVQPIVASTTEFVARVNHPTIEEPPDDDKKKAKKMKKGESKDVNDVLKSID